MKPPVAGSGHPMVSVHRTCAGTSTKTTVNGELARTEIWDANACHHREEVANAIRVLKAVCHALMLPTAARSMCVTAAMNGASAQVTIAQYASSVKLRHELQIAPQTVAT